MIQVLILIWPIVLIEVVLAATVVWDVIEDHSVTGLWFNFY